MSTYVVEIARDFQRPRGEVFAVLEDHNELGRVFKAPMRRVRDGDTSVNGVGSVRKIGFGPLGLEETVTAVERDASIEYRITRGGGPIRNHRGRIDVRDVGTGRSRVEWTIQFDSLPIVGRVVAIGLKRAIGRGLARIG